jgi:hypothetical protein
MVLAAACAAGLLIFTYQHVVPVLRATWHANLAFQGGPVERVAEHFGRATAVGAIEAIELGPLYADFLARFTGIAATIRSDPAAMRVMEAAVAEADRATARALVAEPANDLWYLWRGDLHLFGALLTGDARLGESAVALYREAASISPRRLAPHFEEAAAQLVLGDPAAAERALARAEAIQPGALRTPLVASRIALTQGERRACARLGDGETGEATPSSTTSCAGGPAAGTRPAPHG